MGDLTRAANHLTLEQVKEKMKVSKDTKQLRRWQIVYTALLQPRKAEDIATCVGVSKSLVQKIISCYNREGIKAIEIKSCGGRYHEYLSIEEEEKFLAPFWELAEQVVSDLPSERLLPSNMSSTTIGCLAIRLWSGSMHTVCAPFLSIRAGS